MGLLTSQSQPDAPDQLSLLRVVNSVGVHVSLRGNSSHGGSHWSGSIPFHAESAMAEQDVYSFLIFAAMPAGCPAEPMLL